MAKKSITFITGTRADYGKIKSLLRILANDSHYDVHIIVTGMHLLPSYGGTAAEIIMDNIGTIHLLPNQSSEQSMEISLAKTIEVVSQFLEKSPTQLLVVHGDRIEALAGAITGTLKNVPVGHIEGGEVSGTVDGLIRHSISKLAHLHFVSNDAAKKRLIQLGESEKSIFNIGSPDIDVMFSNQLPAISEVVKRYEIDFEKYGIVIFHPVTTELSTLERQTLNVCSALKKSDHNYIVIKPNNDIGTDIIQGVFEEQLKGANFKHLPSMRFEYFLTLMKHAEYMLGNSSAGVRETSYYGIPSINIGSRQLNRNRNKLILNVNAEEVEILNAINLAKKLPKETIFPFGKGQSDKMFKDILENQIDWPIKTDKVFVDMETNYE